MDAEELAQLVNERRLTTLALADQIGFLFVLGFDGNRASTQRFGCCGRNGSE